MLLLFLLVVFALVVPLPTRSAQRAAVCALLLLALAVLVVAPPARHAYSSPSSSDGPLSLLGATLSAPFTCIHLRTEREDGEASASTSLRDSLDGARGPMRREGSCSE